MVCYSRNTDILVAMLWCTCYCTTSSVLAYVAPPITAPIGGASFELRHASITRGLKQLYQGAADSPASRSFLKHGSRKRRSRGSGMAAGYSSSKMMMRRRQLDVIDVEVITPTVQTDTDRRRRDGSTVTTRSSRGPSPRPHIGDSHRSGIGSGAGMERDASRGQRLASLQDSLTRHSRRSGDSSSSSSSSSGSRSSSSADDRSSTAVGRSSTTTTTTPGSKGNSKLKQSSGSILGGDNNMDMDSRRRRGGYGMHDSHDNAQHGGGGLGDGAGFGFDRRTFLQGAAVATTAAVIPLAFTAFPQLAEALPLPTVPLTGSLSSTDVLIWNPLNRYGSQEQLAAGSNIYNPRFTAYLARFLLNNDPASMAWWRGQSNVVSRDSVEKLSKALMEEGPESVFFDMDVDANGVVDRDEFLIAMDDQRTTFSTFQASVSYGLRNYGGKDGAQRLFKLLTGDFCYNIANKRQIALLFSLLDSEQPVAYIKSLIGETDNSSVMTFEVVSPGSGYDPAHPPTVTVEKPPFRDNGATGKATLKPTGRLFRIKVTSPGKGYVTPPEVTISAPSGLNGKPAKGLALLRGDKVAAIIITNPGKGYDTPPSISIGMPTASTTADGNATASANPIEALMNGASAEALLEFGVSKVEVVMKGSGYGQTLPLKVFVDPPPPRKEFANFGQPAVVNAILSAPPDGEVITSWLPTLNVTQEVTKLLPNNLVPTLDPCLGKFYISPIPQAAPGYCVYFDKDEFEVYPSEKIKTYFSFLDGPRARYPVEKEKPLDLSVYLRFALCGGTCGSIAHAFLVPIDVVKTRMQSNPQRYKQMVPTFQSILKEEGKDAFLLGAGATFIGYLLYGGISFGLTEYFKRKFIEFAGPSLATLYPVPILLTASAGAACFAATAVTPFESLRIKTVTIPGFPKTLFGAISRVVSTGEAKSLLDGVPVLLLAEIPFMMTKFAVFDASSKFLYGAFPLASDSVPLSLCISLFSGMIAGVAASLVSQPCDTILVEVNDGKTKGKADIPKVVQGLLKRSGLPGFYSGAIPRCIKSAANIAIQFFLYDFCKRLAHVSPDDIKVFFDVMNGLELNYTPAMDVVNIITDALP